MKKIYFIVPIILLVIFIFIYMGVRNSIHAQQVAREEQDQKDRKARMEKEQEDRIRAYNAANEEAQKRIAEITAKKAEDDRQAQEKAQATDERDVAFRERNSLNSQVLKLTDDLFTAKEQLTKVQEQIKIQQAQVDYLKTATAEVAQTKSIYENALQKLTNAEKIFQQQQAAAAATAAQQKK